MKMRYPVLIFGGLCCSAWGFLYRPFPLPGKDSVLDLVLYHTPNFYIWIVRWYYAAPAVTVIVGGLLLITVWRVWFEDRNRNLSPLGKLPKWPLKPGDPGPGIVVGEVHHPVKSPSRSGNCTPEWQSSEPSVRWIEQVAADELFLSAVTVGEIQAGIELTREQDVAKAEELEA